MLAAYAERTQVPVTRSKAELEALLVRAGATRVATMIQTECAALAFSMGGRNYRFMLPLTEEPKRGRGRDPAQVARQRWRALTLTVKAKLEAARSGITSLETEFLPYAVLPGGRTVADAVLPGIARAYSTGRDVPLLPEA